MHQGVIVNEPYFSYCAPVWDGIGSKLSDKLQKLKNEAARVRTRAMMLHLALYLKNLDGIILSPSQRR